MTKVIIIDSKQIRYSDNAYRGENVDWFDVSYDQDNINKVNRVIIAEVRDSRAGVHVIDRRHWHELPEEIQELWPVWRSLVEYKPKPPRKDCSKYYYGEPEGWLDRHNLRIKWGGDIWMTPYERIPE